MQHMHTDPAVFRAANVAIARMVVEALNKMRQQHEFTNTGVLAQEVRYTLCLYADICHLSEVPISPVQYMLQPVMATARSFAPCINLPLQYGFLYIADGHLLLNHVGCSIYPLVKVQLDAALPLLIKCFKSC